MLWPQSQKKHGLIISNPYIPKTRTRTSMHEHEVCELQSLENEKEQINNLDHEITEQEIRQAVKN